MSAESIQAYGFLAVFAAGLGLRQAEVKTANSQKGRLLNIWYSLWLVTSTWRRS